MDRTWRLACALAAPAFWVCAAAVLVLALGPVPAQEPLTGWDKSNHVLAFFVLGVLGQLAWPERCKVLLLALAGYGLTIELLQMFVPGRHAHGLDLVGDALGLALAWLLVQLPPVRRLARQSSQASRASRASSPTGNETRR